MTNEEAIKQIEYMASYFDHDVGYEAADMAIEALSQSEVVRCKDCRHYNDELGEVCHNKRFGDGWANYPPPYVDADGGCTYGERVSE